MSDVPADALRGIVARLDELIAARPDGAAGGFAPNGKVRTHEYGAFRSSFHGRGMEFDEARIYQPGDDIRTIDWRVTARTGKVHTKLFHEERERPVLIMADIRTAMRFGTRAMFKSVLAAKAAAVLTWVAIEGNDRVGGMVLSPHGQRQFRPQRSRARILAFVKAIAEATAEGFDEDGFAIERPAAEPSLADALGRLRLTARPGTLVFIVSDFHDFDEAASRELSRLARHSHVTNLLVYDGIEADAPQRGIYSVSDGEAVAVLDADSEAVRQAYAQRFRERREMIEALSRQRGMAFVPLVTGQDPTDVLHPERLRAAGRVRRTAA